MLNFYKEQLAKVRQRLANANIEAPAEARTRSGDLDTDLENLSDLAGAREVLLLVVFARWPHVWHLNQGSMMRGPSLRMKLSTSKCTAIISVAGLCIAEAAGASRRGGDSPAELCQPESNGRAQDPEEDGEAHRA